jgi:hypothetical protein
MAVPFSTVGYSNPAGWGTSGQPGGSCRWSSTRQLRSADRRSEPARPGDLLHLDVNKLDPIPTWRPPPPRRRDQPRQPWRRQVRQAAMRTCTPRSDDHSVPGRRRGLDDERAPTCARLWRRPHHWFALRDASITGVLSDMGRRPKPRVRGGAGPDRRAPPAHQALRRDQRHLERFNRIPLDLDSLTTELLVVVDQTMQPTQASLWLRSPREPPRTPLVPWPRDHTVEPTGAPRGIRTANRQIRSLVLCVDLVGSRRIWPAHVECLVGPGGSRRSRRIVWMIKRMIKPAAASPPIRLRQARCWTISVSVGRAGSRSSSAYK